MSGRPPYWWETLLKVIPRFYNMRGVWLMHWLGSIIVLRRPK